MLRARRAYVRNGGAREPSPGLCSEPFDRPRVQHAVDDDERQALQAEGLDPDDPAVIAAIDLDRWELSLGT
jgi:hypothetical protein